MKLKDTICFFCGKRIKALGKNLAICLECDERLSDEEKLEIVENRGKNYIKISAKT